MNTWHLQGSKLCLFFLNYLERLCILRGDGRGGLGGLGQLLLLPFLSLTDLTVLFGGNNGYVRIILCVSVLVREKTMLSGAS